MPRVLLTFLRMLPAVAGAAVIAVLGLWLARLAIPLDELRQSNPEVGNYIQALGTIYAVVAAFVVSMVWGQFNDARTQIEREASELVDMFRLADGFPDATRRALQERLVLYTDGVIHDELSPDATHDAAAVERTGDTLDEVWTILHQCEPTSECHKSLHAEALTRYSDLSDVRTARLTSARTRIPLALRLLLYFGGVILVMSLYLLAIDRFWIHAAITGSLAAAVSHILYIVHDLDNPFDGDWQVPRTAFERARAYMKRRQDGDSAAAPAVAA